MFGGDERQPYRIALALLCGAAMQFAFSPYDLNWLGLLAVSVWAWLLIDDNRPFLTSYAFGFGWFGFGSWWLADTFHIYGDLPYAVTVGCVVLVGALLGLLPALWGWLAVIVGGHGRWLLLTFPASAVLVEWLRGHLFTGLPWTSLGNLLLDTPASSWAAYAGVYGAAVLPAMLAMALALLANPFHRIAGSVGVVLAAAAIGLAPSPPAAEGLPSTAALIQASIPQDKKWDRAFLEETMRRYEELTSNASTKSDLIVWPEAAVPFFLSRAPGWDEWLHGRVEDWGQPLLFGGLKVTGNDKDAEPQAQNGLFLELPGKAARSFTGKHHLVPFGEYVPSWLPWLHKLVPNIASFQPSTNGGVLKSGNTVFGSLICYESIFPEEARDRVAQGANVLVVVTNDAWYGKSPAAWQHLQAARMRAIETGRYVLRAANSGVSAIISPAGEVTATMPWWQQGSVIGSFITSTTLTAYQQWGDMPPLLIAALLLVSGGVARRFWSET